MKNEHPCLRAPKLDLLKNERLSKSKKNTTPFNRRGVPSPGSLNPNLKAQLSNRKKIDLDEIIQKIMAGDRVYLSKAITLIESKNPKHQALAQQILKACMSKAGKSLRIGITGSPGVGKSTFIEYFGSHLIEQGHQVAVLAIDPSSQISRGSILGDKTRMGELAKQAKAFIRPSPAGESLGGVARKTRETIILCEAAGFDRILIETVGVGQSEIAVHSMTDFFLLLLLPGAGDELQGIKRGIVEMADMIAVNKADGDRLQLAQQAKRAYLNALHLFPPKESNWIPPVDLCSAYEKRGIETISEHIHAFFKQVNKNGFFKKNRQQQARYWLHESIQQQLRQQFYQHPDIQQALEKVEEEVSAERLSSFQAAEQLLAIFKATRPEQDTDPTESR